MATRPTDQEEQLAAVESDLHRYVAPLVGPDDKRVFTDSGIEIDRLTKATPRPTDGPTILFIGRHEQQGLRFGQNRQSRNIWRERHDGQ